MCSIRFFGLHSCGAMIYTTVFSIESRCQILENMVGVPSISSTCIYNYVRGDFHVTSKTYIRTLLPCIMYC